MSEAGKDRTLGGKGIVVTRPAHQAAPLADLICAAGGRALAFPAIEIADVADTRALYAVIDRLDEFDRAIFVSPNAVHQALPIITARRGLPPALRYAAVGRASVRELAKFGVTDVAVPARFDSESLLALPELTRVAGQRLVIFRGVGGRDVLGQTLAARGAHVEYAECYRRLLPRVNPAPLLHAWAAHEIHAVTVTSSEGLRNFCELIGAQGRAPLQQTPVFVPHPRIAATARELGLSAVVETAQGDGGLVAGLQRWFAAHC